MEIKPASSNLRFDMGPAATYRIGPKPFAGRFRKGYARIGGFYGRYGRGGELKFLDTAVALTNITPGVGAFSTTLCAIPQNDTESGRDGRTVVVKSIHFRGQVITDPALAVNERFRVMLIQDTQTNGALPAVLDLLVTNGVNSFRNLENSQRFKFLKDFDIKTNLQINTAATSTIPLDIPIKFSVKCNMRLDYDSSASTGVITTQRSNGFFLLVLAQNNATSDITGTCRIRFSDK